MKKPILLMAVCSALASCGGGSSDSPSSTATKGTDNSHTVQENESETAVSPEGFWIGVDDTGYQFDMVIQNDNEFWLMYEEDGYLRGFMHGTGTVSDDTLTSSNIHDFDFYDGVVYPASVEVDFTPRESLDGQITYDGISHSSYFTGTYVSDYEHEADLTSLVGDYSGNVGGTAGIENTWLRIESDGSFVGESAAGCAYSGELTPDNDGNLFEVSLQFHGGACVSGNQTITGVARYLSSGRIYAGGINSNRKEGYMLVADKQ